MSDKWSGWDKAGCVCVTLVAAVGLVLLGTMHSPGAPDPPCAEDQAYVVAKDYNPEHESPWVCVPRSEVTP